MLLVMALKQLQGANAGGNRGVGGHTLKANVRVGHASCAGHILHSPQLHTAITAAAGNALVVLAGCAA